MYFLLVKIQYKNTEFLGVLFGSMTHFYIQFLKPFLIFKTFFLKLIFDPLIPFFKKKLKILPFFENVLLGHVAHVFICFLSSFQI